MVFCWCGMISLDENMKSRQSYSITKGGKSIDFVTLASHALRTPLSATKWYLEIVRSQKIGPLNDRQADFLSEAYRANERMVKIINDLLLVVRIQHKELELVLKEFQMGDVIKEVVKEISSSLDGTKKKTILNYCYSANIPKSNIDIDKMKQALRNLIMNAIEYTPNDGAVVTIGCERKGKEVVYSVTDTGIGIARKDYKHIFKKFYRSKSVLTFSTEGIGLGLYITKSLIEAHGGSIWFESVEGKGSTFYFSLPISTSDTTPTKRRSK